MDKSDNPFLLPKRRSSFKARDEFSRKKIEQWIDAVSINDAKNAAFALYNKLDRLNQLEISPVNRMETLDLLQPSLDFSLDSLKRSCLGRGAPLNIQARMSADLRMDIMIQAVRCYKTVLAQLHDSSTTGQMFHKHIRSEALRSAIFYLGEILLHSYMVYQPCLHYVWKELHGIYYYSVINELQTAGHAGVDGVRAHWLKIDEIYKQILLLSLANPKSMLKGEVEKVRADLGDWVSQVKLVPIKREVTAESYFWIDAKSDDMPYAPNMYQARKIDVGWCLVTDDLVNMLDEKLTGVAKSRPLASAMRPADAGAMRLLKKLYAAWSQQINPRGLRDSVSGTVELVCGLDAVYLRHGGDALSDAALERVESPAPGDCESNFSVPDDYEPLIEVSPGVVEFQSSSGESEINYQPKKGPAKFITKECVTTNKSANGYYLNWPDNGDAGARVGELIEVNPQNRDGDAADASIGVIRWMNAERSGFLGMGVELLNGIIEPVILQRRHEHAKGTENFKGFLHMGEESLSSLIAPPFYVDRGYRYNVITNRNIFAVDLINIIESTDSFVRFEIAQLPS